MFTPKSDLGNYTRQSLPQKDTYFCGCFYLSSLQILCFSHSLQYHTMPILLLFGSYIIYLMLFSYFIVCACVHANRHSPHQESFSKTLPRTCAIHIKWQLVPFLLLPKQAFSFHNIITYQQYNLLYDNNHYYCGFLTWFTCVLILLIITWAFCILWKHGISILIVWKV